MSLGSGAGEAVLGQWLDYAVAVRLEPDEVLGADCLTAVVQVGDRRLLASQVRVRVEALAADAARVRVQTRVTIDEPVVAVQLTAACGNRVSRRYIVFADPPALPTGSVTAAAEAIAATVATVPASGPAVPASPPGAAASEVAEVRGDAAAGPAAAPAVIVPASAWRPVGHRRPAGAAAARGQRRPRAETAAHGDRRAAQRSTVAPRRLKAAPTRMPRLQLEMALPQVAATGAVEQALQAVAEAAAAARQSASAASAAAERIAALERTVNQLRADAETQRNQAAVLREQLSRTESASAIGWLGAVAVGLALLAGWLALRLSAARRLADEAWQNGAMEGHLPSMSGPAERRPSGAMPFATSEIPSAQVTSPRNRPAPAWPPPAPTDGWEPSEPPIDSVPQAHIASGLSLGGQAVPPSRAAVLPEPAEAQPFEQITAVQPPPGKEIVSAARDVSIDELLDLEQQAEFFVVLGQDDAAIDLLVEHLRHTGGESPMPYLKLLEIYRRRGDRTDYERMRARFNQRFNAYAPDWEVDLQSGRALDGYAGVLQRLQRVWDRPLDSMAELEALMFRKSQGELFDLPAYREILFLYALARELHDRGSADMGSVDLLLPLSAAGEFNTTAPTPLSETGPGSQFQRADFQDRPTAPVDFDLTLDSDRPISIFDALGDAPPVPRHR